MQYLEEVKKWIGEITEIFLLLLALGIVVEILFGEGVPFFGGVVANITTLISKLGNEPFVGLVALGVIVFLFQKKRMIHTEHHHHQ